MRATIHRAFCFDKWRELSLNTPVIDGCSIGIDHVLLVYVAGKESRERRF